MSTDNDLSLTEEDARAFADLFIRMARSSRYRADLLGHIANALHDSHGLAHAHVERIRDWIKEIIRAEMEGLSCSV